MRTAVLTLPQDEFLAGYWAVDPGEHVSLIGPTGTGKTTLGMKLLAGATAQHTDMTGVVLAMKPHKRPPRPGERGRQTGDETVARLTRELGGKIVRSWPAPRRMPWDRPPAFWTFWPEHTFDIDLDEARHSEAFGRLLVDRYKRGSSWVFADETYSLTHEMGLAKPLVTLWTKGRSMDCGLIAATQKPSHVPLWMYSQASHLFLWNDPDKRARQRLGEISGFDPAVIRSVVHQLNGHSCLYLRPRDRSMAILV